LSMISRSGTRTSLAASGVTKILREAGSGPVVTAGSVLSGLERMFIWYPPFLSCCHSGHGPRRGPIRNLDVWGEITGSRQRAPRNDGGGFVAHLMRPLHLDRAIGGPVRRGRRSG